MKIKAEEISLFKDGNNPFCVQIKLNFNILIFLGVHVAYRLEVKFKK